MTVTGPYNLCQQAFVLSMLSNTLSKPSYNQPDTKANLEQRLAQCLATSLTNYASALGPWEVVWGPAVFSVPDLSQKGVADNATYIACKPGPQPIYVLATAGTNTVSKFDIVIEDGAVAATVAWTHAFRVDQHGNPLLGSYQNPPGTTNPALAAGTAAGVKRVLATAPSNNPQRLFEYLKSVQSKDATLIITGHSLGGALSPILALALFTPGGPLQQDAWGQVLVLPSAGATPGNADLQTGFDTMFPVTPTVSGQPDLNLIAQQPVWNYNITNVHDFVPMAWVPHLLAEVPPDVFTGQKGLYPNLAWSSLLMKLKVLAAFGFGQDLSNIGAKSTPAGGTGAAGAYTPLTNLVFQCQEVDPTDAVGSVADYLKHWGKQHVSAYIDQIFQVGALFPPQEKEELHAGLVGAGLPLLGRALSAEPFTDEVQRLHGKALTVPAE